MKHETRCVVVDVPEPHDPEFWEEAVRQLLEAASAYYTASFVDGIDDINRTLAALDDEKRTLAALIAQHVHIRG